MIYLNGTRKQSPRKAIMTSYSLKHGAKISVDKIGEGPVTVQLSYIGVERGKDLWLLENGRAIGRKLAEEYIKVKRGASPKQAGMDALRGAIKMTFKPHKVTFTDVDWR